MAQVHRLRDIVTSDEDGYITYIGGVTTAFKTATFLETYSASSSPSADNHRSYAFINIGRLPRGSKILAVSFNVNVSLVSVQVGTITTFSFGTSIGSTLENTDYNVIAQSPLEARQSTIASTGAVSVPLLTTTIQPNLAQTLGVEIWFNGQVGANQIRFDSTETVGGTAPFLSVKYKDPTRGKLIHRNYSAGLL